MKASSIILAVATFFSTSAFADSKIQCKTISRTPVTVLEYLIRDSQSARLASSAFYTSNSGSLEFPQNSIAQYKTTAVDLFLIADNASGQNQLQLFAVGARKKYVGVISEFGLNGAISKNIAVNCAIVAP